MVKGLSFRVYLVSAGVSVSGWYMSISQFIWSADWGSRPWSQHGNNGVLAPPSIRQHPICLLMAMSLLSSNRLACPEEEPHVPSYWLPQGSEEGSYLKLINICITQL